MASQRLQHVFRCPQYPLLCSVPGDLISAFSIEQLETRLAQFDLPAEAVLDIIDSSGEGWALHNELRAVSPMTFKKTWRKAELLKLYRESATARHIGASLNEKKILRERLDVIIQLIAHLLRDGPPTPHQPSAACRPGNLISIRPELPSI